MTHLSVCTKFCLGLSICLALSLLIAPTPAAAQRSDTASAEEILSALTFEDPDPNAEAYVSLDSVTFEKDRATLRPQAMRQLNEVAKALKDDSLGNTKILIEGHTCTLGSREHNQQLSLDRAKSVRDYLIGVWEIDASRLEVLGVGGDRPVADNMSPGGPERNRRVDFVRISADSQPASPALQVAALSESRKGFLGVEVWAKLSGTQQQLMLSATNNILHSGDGYQLRITVLEAGHLYVAAVAPSGDVTWLYPDDLAVARWTLYGDLVLLPRDLDAGDTWISLGDAVGEDSLYVILSDMPLADLSAAAELLAKRPRDTKAIEASLGKGRIHANTFIIDHR